MRVLVPLVGAVGIGFIFLGLSEGPARRRRIHRFLESVAHEAGARSWSPGKLISICLSCAFGAAILVSGATGSAPIAAIGGAAGAWAPIGWLRGRTRRNRRRHREVWPEAIDLLVAGVRSGASLPEVVAGLADRGPEVLRGSFERFRSGYRSASSFDLALRKLGDDLSDPTADRVLSALIVAHDVGGSDLVRVLRTLGDFVRDDLRVRREIEARWSWTVTAARVAAAAPWIVLLLMATRPEAAAAYDSPSGLLLITGGGVATIAGYRLMLRAARLPDEKRMAL